MKELGLIQCIIASLSHKIKRIFIKRSYWYRGFLYAEWVRKQYADTHNTRIWITELQTEIFDDYVTDFDSGIRDYINLYRNKKQCTN